MNKRDRGSPEGAQTAHLSTRTIEMVSDRINSRDLFVGTREIVIVHGSETYRLRLTAQNKLILTK